MSIQVGKDEDGRFYILRNDAIVASCKDYEEARFKAGVKAQSWREPVDLREVVAVWKVLDQIIGALAATLATGRYDAHLPAVLAAEVKGRNRKGAIAALRERMVLVGIVETA